MSKTSIVQSGTIVHVWPEGKIPGAVPDAPEGPRSPERTDAIRITNISTPTLTIFPADRGSEPAPAMIVCPGGGYGYVVYDKEGTEIAQWLNSEGITALVLKYRVPSLRDEALMDIQRSLRLARKHAPEWNIDPNRLGVIGFSAGGNLSAKASNRFEEQMYPAIDSIDQKSCRPDFAILVYPSDLQRDGQVAPDLHLNPRVSPTLMIHNEDDERFIAGSRLYASELKDLNVNYEFKLYQIGGHAYGLRSEKEVRDWPNVAVEWLKANGFQN